MNKNKGFTIIEALIAIFILTVSVSSMLGVNVMSASFARYSNNEITANYLLQEAVDSIRNSRDTIAFKMNDELIASGSNGWDTFLKRYGYDVSSGAKNKCFSSNGCYLEMEKFKPSDTGTDRDYFLSGSDVVECSSSGCKSLNYDTTLTSSLFYSYNSTLDNSQSMFSRKVTMEMVNPYEVKIVATIYWNNGNGSTVTKSQKLEMSLLNWQN